MSRYQEAIQAANLTVKQARVLDLLAEGHSLRRIALALGTSESNVRGHRDAAFRKLRPHLPKEDQAA